MLTSFSCFRDSIVLILGWFWYSICLFPTLPIVHWFFHPHLWQQFSLTQTALRNLTQPSLILIYRFPQEHRCWPSHHGPTCTVPWPRPASSDSNEFVFPSSSFTYIVLDSNRLTKPDVFSANNEGDDGVRVTSSLVELPSWFWLTLYCRYPISESTLFVFSSSSSFMTHDFLDADTLTKPDAFFANEDFASGGYSLRPRHHPHFCFLALFPRGFLTVVNPPLRIDEKFLLS